MSDDLKSCPHCGSENVHVGMRCDYVVCGDCFMTGPNGQPEEAAVELWNSLPRRGKYQYCEKCGNKLDPGYYHYCLEEADDEVTPNPKCDRCGGDVIPGIVHYCLQREEITA